MGVVDTAPQQTMLQRVLEVLDTTLNERDLVVGVEVCAFKHNKRFFKNFLKLCKSSGMRVILFSDLSPEEEELLAYTKAKHYTLIHSVNPYITAGALGIEIDVWMCKASHPVLH